MYGTKTLKRIANAVIFAFIVSAEVLEELDKYGYKVCYKYHKKLKTKIYVITNTYDLALLELKLCKLSHKCFIKPIKTYSEYKNLWKHCPF